MRLDLPGRILATCLPFVRLFGGWLIVCARRFACWHAHTCLPARSLVGSTPSSRSTQAEKGFNESAPLDHQTGFLSGQQSAETQRLAR